MLKEIAQKGKVGVVAINRKITEARRHSKGSAPFVTRRISDTICTFGEHLVNYEWPVPFWVEFMLLFFRMKPRDQVTFGEFFRLDFPTMVAPRLLLVQGGTCPSDIPLLFKGVKVVLPI